MSTATMEQPGKTKAKDVGDVIVPPFGVEVDHPQRCDVLLQSIPGQRLRSRTGATSTTVKGVVRTPQSKGHTIPDLPGMQLFVNPAELTYVVNDPLNDDDSAKSRLRQHLRTITGVRQDADPRGAATIKGSLDVHRMKCLCREVIWLLNEGAVRVIRGAAPEMDDVDELPGKYLLNPGLQTQSTQPVYEEDYEGWKSQLTRSGG